MSKVFGIHTVALRPGVDAEEFEKFVAEEVYPLPWPEDLKVYFLKGDRGDREGKYLWIWEYESVEARNRDFPTLGSHGSEDFRKRFEDRAEVVGKFGDSMNNAIFTDYVVVGK